MILSLALATLLLQALNSHAIFSLQMVGVAMGLIANSGTQDLARRRGAVEWAGVCLMLIRLGRWERTAHRRRRLRMGK